MLDEDQKKCAGISCGSVFVLSLSIAMIIIGCLNVDLKNIECDDANVSECEVQSDTCKIEPKIPFFLLVAGILFIALFVIRVILQRCCKSCCGGDTTDNKLCATCGFLSNIACITIYDVIALTLVVIWLIVGSNWIFPNWDAVYDQNDGEQCAAYLYYFSFAAVIISWIGVALTILCGLLCTVCSCFWGILCCKPCRDADAQPV